MSMPAGFRAKNKPVGRRTTNESEQKKIRKGDKINRKKISTDHKKKHIGALTVPRQSDMNTQRCFTYKKIIGKNSFIQVLKRYDV